jgi:hypothetical protein
MRKSTPLDGVLGPLAALVMLLWFAPPSSAAEVIDLGGPWRFLVDRGDRGVAEKWQQRLLAGHDSIRLPGMMQAQEKGDPVSENTPWTGEIVDRSWFTAPEYAKYRQPGNIKVPFWLQPERHYVGAAWYQREFEIPAAWSGRRVTLLLERPHIETRAWLDDRLLGSCKSLSTPHAYVLGRDIAAGKHRLTIRVDNRLVVDVGINSHSVSDHTQGNWNGIVGRIALESGPPLWIADLQVTPHLRSRSVTVKGRIGNATGQAGQGTIALALELPASDQRASLVPRFGVVSWTEQGGTFSEELPLGFGAPLWDEFNPALYRVTATLGYDASSARTVTFGLREIDTAGTQFRINGRKVLFRGTLECAIFPKTGHPPTDVASWKRIIGIARDHGLNLFRFHSWCPPEAAFQAADELGFYFQVECGSWANTSTALGEGKPIDDWLYEEAERILATYGNHPSFVLLAYGNEPAGKHEEYLTKWVNHFKARDPRRLYTGGAGWPQLAVDQYHIAYGPRIQAWGDGLKSRINARPPETTTDYRDYVGARSVPVLSHEVGQWCVYPNFAEMAAYTGPFKPRNFEIFRESLEAHGMLDQAHEFLNASGKLQVLCYKEDVEALLRTPGLGGFELLALYDFPGQGTALVGVLDALWNSKGYVTPGQFRRFCNCTVPLARLSRRVFTSDQPFEAAMEVAHFGPKPLKDAVLGWSIVGADGKTMASGRKFDTIPVDNGIALGTITASLRDLPAPARYRLVLALEGTPFENHWDFWVYPPERQAVAAPSGVTVVSRLDEKAAEALRAGGRVLWLIPPGSTREDRLGKVALGFSSIFWNSAWTRRQPPHTLGILCDPAHPALANFPTESHTNWQWWYLLSRAGALILDDLPRDLRPVVQVIDDWVTNRRLGLIVEASVGPGKLLICSIDLEHGLEQNPVARQLRAGLMSYLASDRFNPRTTLSVDQARTLMKDQ